MNEIHLEIFPHLKRILKILSLGHVSMLAIEAPTGSGKSLGIPWAVALTGKRIMVSVPTIQAATSLSETLTTISKGRFTVGYAAGGVVKYNEKTQVVYATAKHVVNKILKQNKNSSKSPAAIADVLLIDEIHTGSVENLMLISLWKYFSRISDINPKLMLASAKFDRTRYPDAVIYPVAVKTYPITIIHHGKDYRVNSVRALLKDMVHTIAVEHDRMRSDLSGHFLVFVPGKGEVKTIIDSLKVLPDVHLIQAYSGLSKEERDMIYADSPPGKRKIIVGTNVLETSVTIDGVTFVFDSMLEKRMVATESGGSRLITDHISQASSIQRMGRTGRTAPGNYYRFMTAKFYRTDVKENREEDVKVSPIYNEIMDLINSGIDPYTIFKEVSNAKIDWSIKLLTALQMIDGRNQVTEIGNFSKGLVLGARNSTVLYHWIHRGYPVFPGIVVVSLIDSFDRGYFYYPGRSGKTEMGHREETDKIKEFFNLNFAGESDVHTIINVWNKMMTAVGGAIWSENGDGFIKGWFRNVKKWSADNSMNNKKIKDLIEVINMVWKNIKHFEMDILDRSTGSFVRAKPFITPQIFTTEGAITVLTSQTIIVEEGLKVTLPPILEFVYQDMIMKLANRVETNRKFAHMKTGKIFSIDTRESINQMLAIDSSKIPYIIGLRTHELSSGRKGFITLGINLEKLSLSNEDKADFYLLPTGVIDLTDSKPKQVLSTAPVYPSEAGSISAPSGHVTPLTMEDLAARSGLPTSSESTEIFRVTGTMTDRSDSSVRSRGPPTRDNLNRKKKILMKKKARIQREYREPTEDQRKKLVDAIEILRRRHYL